MKKALSKDINKLHASLDLLASIKQLIDESRKRVAVAVNAELTMLYWHIGIHIHSSILQGGRAEYGKKIILNLSHDLFAIYGDGWSERQLRYCLRIAEIFSDKKIVNTLCAKLSWSHLRLLIVIEDSLKRDFYIELCRLENWSVRQLQERINSQLFERTALSKKSDELIAMELAKLRKGKSPSPELLLKDPYVLDFLGLKDRYIEKDIEDAILREIEQFLLELGAGFTFVERQKRLQIDNRDYYIDLLFYNRKLKRLIVIELKIGEFEAGFKGQMELYLRWLAKNESEKGDNPPLGIILCTGKSTEQIELLELDKSGIHVAEYLTVLPPREVLQEKLHQSIKAARQRMLDDKRGWE